MTEAQARKKHLKRVMLLVSLAGTDDKRDQALNYAGSCLEEIHMHLM
jgi:hypothetical protein